MIQSICIKTPAGEVHQEIIDDKDAPNHACHTALRIGMSRLMHWVDSHVDWRPGHQPVIKTEFHGSGDWQIRMHPNDRKCELCEEAK